MKESKKIVLIFGLVAALAVGFASPHSCYAGRPHARDGWQLGFSYGYSPGRVTLANGAEGEQDGGATPQIRLGHRIGRKFALGLEYSGWLVEGGDAELKLRSSLQQLTVAGTWYPGDPTQASGGFYMRGGIGLGWASLSAYDPEVSLQTGNRIDESGLAIMATVGYELRISRAVAAGVSLGYNYLSINKDLYESGWFTPVAINLAWYWN